MAKPSNLFRWSTNASTTTEPTSGQKDAGFAANDRPPAKWLNWLWNGAYQWFSYLDNLHGETDFLNKGYGWTAVHTFNANTNTNGLVNNSGSIRNIAGVISALSTQNGFTYVDGAGSAALPSRTVMIPLAYAGSTPGWVSTGGGLLSALANAPVEIPITHFLRSGCVVTRVRVAIDLAPGATAAPSFTVRRKVADKATPGIGTLNTERSDTDGTAGTTSGTPQTMSTGTFTSTTVDLSTEEWYVRVVGSDNASGDVILWVEVQFNDLGPRNQ